MTERDFYTLIEGTNEFDQPKATCVVSILQPDDKGDPEIVAQTVTHNGVVYMAIIPDGLSMIDIIFDTNVDYEFLQLGGLCEQFFDNVAAANREGGLIQTLALSIMENDTLDTNMSCVDCVWTYIPVTAEKVCVGVRFLCKTENIIFTELDEDQVDALLGEAIDLEVQSTIKGIN